MSKRKLAEMLWVIEKTDQVGDYQARNHAVLLAIGYATDCGYATGFAFDVDAVDPAYPIVVYINLPTGQVSWHLPEFALGWDGHTTEEKYARCRAFTGLVGI